MLQLWRLGLLCTLHMLPELPSYGPSAGFTHNTHAAAAEMYSVSDMALSAFWTMRRCHSRQYRLSQVQQRREPMRR
jgi:hypothetical protein